jgi:hypothetical protein
MMAPESQYTTSGRANPSGIPFLFLSENENLEKTFWIALTHLLICSNKLYFLEYYQHNQLYQPGYEQYSFWQKFSASNSRAFNSEQIQILLSFSTVLVLPKVHVCVKFYLNKSFGASFNCSRFSLNSKFSGNIRKCNGWIQPKNGRLS